MHRDRILQQKQRLLPVRRDALRARAEARDLPLRTVPITILQALGRAHTPASMRTPAERPDLREDGVALADGVRAHVRADRGAVRGEERVEVERERVRFRPLERRRRERERHGEVELLWRDGGEGEVLRAVWLVRGAAGWGGVYYLDRAGLAEHCLGADYVYDCIVVHVFPHRRQVKA